MGQSVDQRMDLWMRIWHPRRFCRGEWHHHQLCNALSNLWLVPVHVATWSVEFIGTRYKDNVKSKKWGFRVVPSRFIPKIPCYLHPSFPCHQTVRLWAVSLLLENPRGRTQKAERARYSGDDSRARAAKPRVARAREGFDRLPTSALFAALPLALRISCVLPRRFSSKRETARSLSECSSQETSIFPPPALSPAANRGLLPLLCLLVNIHAI